MHRLLGVIPVPPKNSKDQPQLCERTLPQSSKRLEAEMRFLRLTRSQRRWPASVSNRSLFEQRTRESRSSQQRVKEESGGTKEEKECRNSTEQGLFGKQGISPIKRFPEF